MEHIAFGMAIRALRERKQLSAKELSVAAGFPEYAVSRIENGNVRLDFGVALKLTSAMGLTANDLASMAAKLTPPEFIEKTEELQAVKAQLRAHLKEFRVELLAQANSL